MKRKYILHKQPDCASDKWRRKEKSVCECARTTFIGIHDTRSNGESLPSGTIMLAIVSTFPFFAIRVAFAISLH